MTDKILAWIKSNKWLVTGLAIAVLNPVPSGVILGVVMLTEEKFKKTGQLVLIVSVVLVIISFLILIFTQRAG